jgi:hypothetical protein
MQDAQGAAVSGGQVVGPDPLMLPGQLQQAFTGHTLTRFL